MRERIPQSGTTRVTFDAYLANDHLTPATGKVIAVTLSKNGGAYGNPAAGATNAVEIGNGSYYVDVPTGDKSTLGPLIVRGIEGTIDPVKLHFDVVDDIEAIRAKTVNLPSDPADASDIATSFASLNTLLSTTGVALTAGERTALAAATLTTFQASTDWKELLANVEGAFTFTPPGSYPGSGTLVLKNKAGTVTLCTITLGFDANQVVTSRSVV